MTRTKEIILAAACLAFLALAIFYATLYYTSKPAPEPQSNFTLLDPAVAALDTDLFQEQQRLSQAPGRDLRAQFLEELAGENGTYGVYFEDLNSGGWVGINEKLEYRPRSLFKVPVLIAILKKVEEETLRLDQVALIREEDIQEESTLFTEKDAGTYMTIETLLEKMIRDSDNTALHVLSKHINSEDLLYASTAIGVELARNPSNNFTLSPKEYAAIMRSLYKSQDLRRRHSQYALELLSTTIYTKGLPAGVPTNITVAHKIGADERNKLRHDCGIIYHPQRPYILCIMSQNTTRTEAERVTRSLSKIAYEYQESLA